MRMHWIRNLMTHNADGVPNKSPTPFLVVKQENKRVAPSANKIGCSKDLLFC